MIHPILDGIYQSNFLYGNQWPPVRLCQVNHRTKIHHRSPTIPSFGVRCQDSPWHVITAGWTNLSTQTCWFSQNMMNTKVIKKIKTVWIFGIVYVWLDLWTVKCGRSIILSSQGESRLRNLQQQRGMRYAQIPPQCIVMCPHDGQFVRGVPQPQTNPCRKSCLVICWAF